MLFMISINADNIVFNYRVAGIALRDGAVLLHRGPDDEFWTLPGGRCELLEPSAETLVREMQEELGQDVRVDRLLWVVENFFRYCDHDCHEIGFYYLMSFSSDSPLQHEAGPWYGREGAVDLIFEWYPIDRLQSVIVKPSFLYDTLRALPDGPVHIVHRDR